MSGGGADLEVRANGRDIHIRYGKRGSEIGKRRGIDSERETGQGVTQTEGDKREKLGQS